MIYKHYPTALFRSWFKSNPKSTCELQA